MSEFTCVEAKNRFRAIRWTVEHLGLPKGFEGHFVGYSLYVDEVMDMSGCREEYVLDSTGKHVAYFAWCVSCDIHHKGDILDVTSVVINPEADSKGLQRFLAKRFKYFAELHDCDWVSRCKHEGETMRVYFKEV